MRLPVVPADHVAAEDTTGINSRHMDLIFTMSQLIRFRTNQKNASSEHKKNFSAN